MPPAPEEQIASRQRFSDEMKADVEEALKKLDADPSSEFDINIESIISSCNYHFHAVNMPPGYWAIDLHDIWMLFIWCAKGTPADDPRQDQCAMQILHVRELGDVFITKEDTPREALMEGERIWIDLPYLVQDFRNVWEKALDMKPSHMHNLAAFTARLAGVGVCEDKLTFCMLQLCRQILETERQAGEPPLAELLPAIGRWFIHCGEKLNRLCINSHIFPEETRFLPGPLAQAAGVQENGFSVSRWLFWRKTIKDFAVSGDEKLAEEGKRVFDHMMLVGQQTQNKLPGESKYWDKVWKTLGNEMAERNKNGGNHCVEITDVKIDLNWVHEE